MTTFAKDHLKAFIERIERLEEEKKAIADDIRDIYLEAKANGFDVKALRAIVKLRKQDADERKEQEAILETYMHALGMLSDTPLGESAIQRASQNSKKRLRESMKDQAAVAQEAADAGFISQEAADETKQIAEAVARKLAAPPPRSGPAALAETMASEGLITEEKAAKAAVITTAMAERFTGKDDGLDIPDYLRRRKPAEATA